MMKPMIDDYMMLRTGMEYVHLEACISHLKLGEDKDFQDMQASYKKEIEAI